MLIMYNKNYDNNVPSIQFVCHLGHTHKHTLYTHCIKIEWR